MKSTRRKFIVQSVLASTSFSFALNAFGESISKPLGRGPIMPKGQNGAKISIFSKNLQWLNYSDMAAAVAGMGFDGIDLTVRPDGHVLPEKVAEDLPMAVEAIRKAGLDVYMITTAIVDPAHPHTEAILKVAGKLGIGYYRTGWFPYDEKRSVAQNLEAFKIKLSALAKLNKKYGIRGDYQNHSGTSLGAAIWDLWMVLKEVDPQWMGCQYDIRHATVEAANSWPVGLELIHPYIHTLDLKDFLWALKNGKWLAETVPLGEGLVDFGKYFALLKRYQLSGPFSLHYEYPLGGAEDGARQITMKKEEVLATMQKDLYTLRNWLKAAGL